MKTKKFVIKGKELQKYLSEITSKKRDYKVMVLLLYFFTIISIPTGILYLFSGEKNMLVHLYFLIGVPLGLVALINFFWRD